MNGAFAAACNDRRECHQILPRSEASAPRIRADRRGEISMLDPLEPEIDLAQVCGLVQLTPDFDAIARAREHVQLAAQLSGDLVA
jgi:hypothetical protein